MLPDLDSSGVLDFPDLCSSSHDFRESPDDAAASASYLRLTRRPARRRGEREARMFRSLVLVAVVVAALAFPQAAGAERCGARGCSTTYAPRSLDLRPGVSSHPRHMDVTDSVRR